MKKVLNWLYNWFFMYHPYSKKHQTYTEYIFELGKIAGRCEAETEQLKKEIEQDAH